MYKYHVIEGKQNVVAKKTDEIDETTSTLFPNIENFVPISISGDGNCLFRAIRKI